MPGGLMQLVAYGAENLYLTGNPQITFFKTVYRRHTNFAMEYIEQYFEKLPSFTEDKETISKVKIERNADLFYDCYLVYDLPAIYNTDLFKFKWVNNIGLRIIDYVEIFVDGQLLDKQYGQWMYIWNELTLDLSKRGSYNRLIGNISELTNPQFSHGFYTGVNSVPSIPATRLMIPLEFWFCKNPGLAIPLIALQYNEITINFHFNPLNDLYVIEHREHKEHRGVHYSPSEFPSLISKIQSNLNHGGIYESEDDTNLAISFINILKSHSVLKYYIGNLTDTGVWKEDTFLLVNYIYLDDDERRKFALSSHEYLITQTVRRETGALKGSNNVIEYKFQHPIKDMVWVFQRDDALLKNDWDNFTNLLRDENFTDESTEFSSDDPHDITLVEKIKSYSQIGITSTNDGKVFNNFVDIMYNCKFIINGKDRFSTRTSVFFNSLVPYKYNTNTPADGIYTYSFALYPEKYQPSGNCNFSRINRFQMDVDLRHARDSNTEKEIHYDMYVYGINYNVFRIIGGIGGIAFN